MTISKVLADAKVIGIPSGGVMRYNKQHNPMTPKQFKDALSPLWFASPSAFQEFALHTCLVLLETMCDSVELQGILICEAIGLSKTVTACRKCNGPVHMKQMKSESWEWMCTEKGHKLSLIHI